MTESNDSGSVEDAPGNQSAGVVHGNYVWFGIGAASIAVVLIYRFWEPITRIGEAAIVIFGATGAFFALLYGVRYALHEIFTQKNLAAAIFFVGILAVAAWLFARLLL